MIFFIEFTTILLLIYFIIGLLIWAASAMYTHQSGFKEEIYYMVYFIFWWLPLYMEIKREEDENPWKKNFR